jgi:hypothetical protein
MKQISDEFNKESIEWHEKYDISEESDDSNSG